MRLCHGGFRYQCLSPSFILVDSEVVLSVLHFQIGFLACRSVRHACICVCGSGSHDNLKQRHICKRAEVNHVWVLLMSCRIEDCPKTCSSIHIINATMPWRFPTPKFSLSHYDRLRACSVRGSWRLDGCTCVRQDCGWKQSVHLW
jgi:hypothetical protein